MGYAAYYADISMKGGKKEREKAFSFFKSFFDDEDGKNAKNADYTAFKKEMGEIWGEKDSDYFGTSARDMECWGNEENFSASFCRDSSEPEAAGFFQPLFKSFPKIDFFFMGEKYWYNNAGQQSGSGIFEHGSFNGKKSCNDFKDWLASGLVDLDKKPEGKNRVDAGKNEYACLALLDLVPGFADYIDNPTPKVIEKMEELKKQTALRWTSCTVSCKGEKAELTKLKDFIKADKETKALPAAFKFNSKTNSFTGESPDFALFMPLMQKFPSLEFVFDADFRKNAIPLKESGSGRYFCIFEQGKMVYSINSFFTLEKYMAYDDYDRGALRGDIEYLADWDSSSDDMDDSVLYDWVNQIVNNEYDDPDNEGKLEKSVDYEEEYHAFSRLLIGAPLKFFSRSEEFGNISGKEVAEYFVRAEEEGRTGGYQDYLRRKRFDYTRRNVINNANKMLPYFLKNPALTKIKEFNDWEKKYGNEKKNAAEKPAAKKPSAKKAGGKNPKEEK